MSVSINGSVGILTPSILTDAPTTVTTTPYVMPVAQTSFIFNGSSTIVVTLPTPATYVGQFIFLKTVANQAVNSATSNVVLLSNTSAGAPILTNTAGKWAIMQSDGTNWVIMASN